MEHEDDVRLEPPGPVAVLGAGTMGHGIAQVAAMAGYETRLFDVEAGALDRARGRVEANLDKGIELGKLEPGDRDRALANLRTTTELEDATRGARVVVEAVPEKLALKQEVLGRAAASAADNALLASNTSSLSITSLAEPVPSPERVVGLHFFNPVHIMALVEVVQGDRSAPHAVERARDFAERLGKTPIVVHDSPGFASSRLGVALGLEAIRMLEEGVASAEDIDRAMELGYRHPMGPLRLTDLVGLDVRLEIARYLHSELGERFRPPELLVRMVGEGKLGRKSGQGFYSW
ncbi:MAG TPA: 3-hydroxyacyl-CoA dehydrogenase family protein [Gemmatimonadota bacterium]|nr:3-hydroxyacyl-CoA dehydrogenase family protein [Gemmatimonadota bacterium]